MRKRRPSPLNHLSAALMMRCLLDGHASVPEIAYETGISYTTVRRYIKALREAKVIHIAGWDSDTRGRRTLAAYSIGEKKDADRPPPVPGCVKARKYRANLRLIAQSLGA